MPKLKIDGMDISVVEGSTILDAAHRLDIEIPQMCHLKGFEPETSCMVCVVKDLSTGEIIPSCSVQATEGMQIDTTCEEVRAVRKNMLELLLSEHVGNCEAPCERLCPASNDTPRMLREMVRSDPEFAEWIARRDLVLPSSLSYVCSAPCEKGCTRAQLDKKIPIRKLHRFHPTSDDISFSSSYYMKRTKADAPEVAVLGAGPAGLAAAWQLQLAGFRCTLFDKEPEAGGLLLTKKKLPQKILQAELQILQDAGITFKLGSTPKITEIRKRFKGVVNSGTFKNKHFYAEEDKVIIKAIANGKATANELIQSLKKETTPLQPFDSNTGSLAQEELTELQQKCPEIIKEIGKQKVTAASRYSSEKTTIDPSNQNLTEQEKKDQIEARRCLHCDCRKPTTCRLRKYAQEYQIDQQTFPAEERKKVQLIRYGQTVIFEPGKCIKCRRCVKITQQANEKYGLAFSGRGFNLQITVPLEGPLNEALQTTADECVAVCPTGALAFLDREEENSN